MYLLCIQLKILYSPFSCPLPSSLNTSSSLLVCSHLSPLSFSPSLSLSLSLSSSPLFHARYVGTTLGQVILEESTCIATIAVITTTIIIITMVIKDIIIGTKEVAVIVQTRAFCTTMKDDMLVCGPSTLSSRTARQQFAQSVRTVHSDVVMCPPAIVITAHHTPLLAQNLT